MKRRRQSVLDKRKAKQLEDQRRAELAKLKREDGMYFIYNLIIVT